MLDQPANASCPVSLPLALALRERHAKCQSKILQFLTSVVVFGVGVRAAVKLGTYLETSGSASEFGMMQCHEGSTHSSVPTTFF